MLALPRLTQNSKHFDTGANGTKISSKSFRRSEKLLVYEPQTIQPNIPLIPGKKKLSNGMEIPRKKFSIT